MNIKFRNAKLTLALSTAIASTSFIYSNAQAMELAPTVEDAIMHNPEFREKIKIHQGVQADVDGAKGSWYPVIDLGMGIGTEETERANRSNTNLTRTEGNIRLSENLFEGFGTQNEITRQQARLTSAHYTTQSRANEIALDMVTAYINLLKEHALRELSEESKKTHEQTLDQIQLRTDAGISNQVELDQAKARLALANSNLHADYNNYNDTVSKFQRILGRMPDSDLVKPTLNVTLPSTLKDAINIALREHPALRSNDADIAEARALHATAAKSYYPRIDFDLEQTFDNNTGGIEGKSRDFQAMLRLKYNLYNGGKDSANRDRTASSVQQATEIRNNSRRQTIENLRYAWDAKHYIGEQLVYIKQHIKLTRETLEGYRQQFSLGRRSLLDLLNTEDEYINALRTLVESESEYKIAEYRILSSMGTLIEALDIDVKYDAVETDSPH